MTTYRAQIRYVGSPCSATDYEVVWSGSLGNVDKAWRNQIACPQRDSTGHSETISTAVLNHQIVIIDDAGREYGLDEAPQTAIDQFAR
jgi:hypothetical protein